MNEIEFDSKIGDFLAEDLVGNGSLDLLNVLVYYVGHMAALARAIMDTFVLLAGDTCHFGGPMWQSLRVVMPD